MFKVLFIFANAIDQFRYAGFIIYDLTSKQMSLTSLLSISKPTYEQQCMIQDAMPVLPLPVILFRSKIESI